MMVYEYMHIYMYEYIYEYMHIHIGLYDKSLLPTYLWFTLQPSSAQKITHNLAQDIKPLAAE